jgi:hypothetical protein
MKRKRTRVAASSGGLVDSLSEVQIATRLAKAGSALGAYSAELQNPAIVRAVRKAGYDRTLTLVFGAGVSNDIKLPLWPNLVDSLYDDVYRQIDPRLKLSKLLALRAAGYSHATMIRHLEIMLGFPSIVRRMLRDRLYAKFDERGVKKLIDPICRLFLTAGASAATNHVITYNFDNALERCLKRNGRTDFTSIYSNDSYPLKSGGLRIYHPHGFLPHREDDPNGHACDESIVFSERDYNEHFMDDGHWANILQLHHFMNRTCLFIGASLTDPNTRRLLDHARRKTGASVRHVSIQKSTKQVLTDNFVERDLASLGVATLWVADHGDIPKLLENCAGIRRC